FEVGLDVDIACAGEGYGSLLLALVGGEPDELARKRADVWRSQGERLPGVNGRVLTGAWSDCHGHPAGADLVENHCRCKRDVTVELRSSGHAAGGPTHRAQPVGARRRRRIRISDAVQSGGAAEI